MASKMLLLGGAGGGVEGSSSSSSSAGCVCDIGCVVGDVGDSEVFAGLSVTGDVYAEAVWFVSSYVAEGLQIVFYNGGNVIVLDRDAGGGSWRLFMNGGTGMVQDFQSYPAGENIYGRLSRVGDVYTGTVWALSGLNVTLQQTFVAFGTIDTFQFGGIGGGTVGFISDPCVQSGVAPCDIYRAPGDLGDNFQSGELFISGDVYATATVTVTGQGLTGNGPLLVFRMFSAQDVFAQYRASDGLLHLINPGGDVDQASGTLTLGVPYEFVGSRVGDTYTFTLNGMVVSADYPAEDIERVDVGGFTGADTGSFADMCVDDTVP